MKLTPEIWKKEKKYDKHETWTGGWTVQEDERH